MDNIISYVITPYLHIERWIKLIPIFGELIWRGIKDLSISYYYDEYSVFRNVSDETMKRLVVDNVISADVIFTTATGQNRINLIKYLLSNYSGIITTHYIECALHSASYRKYYEMTKILLSNYETDYDDDCLINALCNALNNKKLKTIKLLLNDGRVDLDEIKPRNFLHECDVAGISAVIHDKRFKKIPIHKFKKWIKHATKNDDIEVLKLLVQGCKFVEN